MTADQDRPPSAGLRERAAVGMLRTAADLARARHTVVDRIAVQPAGWHRDQALTDLAVGAWRESALLWLGWRLLPRASLSAHLSAP